MSVSSLPEWKQLLLERKRREEEEREKREKEEEAKLASIESPLSPDTITTVQQNPFIRTHGGLRRGREEEMAGEMGHEKGNEQEIEVGREREKEKERGHVKGHDGESGRGRDIELKLQQYRERSRGRERDRSRARSTEREVVVGRQAEPQVRDRRGSEAIRRGSDARDAKRMSEVRDCTMSVETTQQNCVITLSVDRASPPQSVESHYRRVSALTECSTTLLSAVAHRGTDWRSSQGAPGNHSTKSALSQPPQPNRARSITINSRSLLTPSHENSLHPDQGVPPSTSSSPCSPSPPQSPSVSPSPSPSPIHFTIRTGSGGQQVKRGTTITITPRKPVGGEAVESVSVSSGPPVKTSAKSQMPVLTEIVERGKKRYPTTEEIEVIGGYQNLDKSCLVKTPKGTPKGVKNFTSSLLPPFEPPVPRMPPPPTPPPPLALSLALGHPV
uniref:Phostensin/Taperin PP1-binding domain-containing protein n=1 Tax=Oncorhynchus mykiss TaxID=8022 RepID=A0A8K9UD51_ONCMY